MPLDPPRAVVGGTRTPIGLVPIFSDLHAISCHIFAALRRMFKRRLSCQARVVAFTRWESDYTVVLLIVYLSSGIDAVRDVTFDECDILFRCVSIP